MLNVVAKSNRYYSISILRFMTSKFIKNQNENVIKDFGQEWERYNQRSIDKKELLSLYKNYFSIFPFEKIGKNSVGFDMGCGSGRWAKFIAPKVKTPRRGVRTNVCRVSA